MRPIETLYRGERFRSRLAARWAVYFYALEIQYEYVSAETTLPSGARFLPDFLLEQVGLHVSVRVSRKISLPDLRAVVEFAVDEDNPLLLIVGNPLQESMYLLDRVHAPAADELQYAIEGDASDEEIVEVNLDNWSDFASVKFGPTPRSRGWQVLYRDLPPPDQLALKDALVKARNAFSAGESG